MAGTRLRIRSGSQAEAFVATLLEENRFTTATFTKGDIRFTDPSVELRVIAPQEGVQHGIRFLPKDDFAYVNCRLLRKADGTTFVILPQGNASFADGTYQLKLTYRRDNSATDAGAPVFSERGITDDETTVIVIPYKKE